MKKLKNKGMRQKTGESIEKIILHRIKCIMNTKEKLMYVLLKDYTYKVFKEGIKQGYNIGVKNMGKIEASKNQ